MKDEFDNSQLFEELAPMATRRAAVVIGRFNPPTRGHYQLINLAKKFIRSNPDLDLAATPVVVIVDGGAADRRRNPLTAQQRENFMRASGHANGVVFTTAPNAFSAFALLREQGWEPIAVAAGSDRINDYIRILNNYFKTPQDEKITHFAIKLARAAGHDGDAELSDRQQGQELDVKHISATLARRAAELDYFDEFADIVGLTSKPQLAKKMFDLVRYAMQE